MNFTHLQQRPSGHIYHYTHILAQRKDMVPCNLDAKGRPTSSLPENVPVSAHKDISAALSRLDHLEDQMRSVVAAVAKMPGGKELLLSRDTDIAVEIPSAPPPPKPAPPAAAPTPDAMASDEHVDIQVARQDIVDAEKKVAAQDKYLAERSQVQADATHLKDELEAAIKTTDNADDLERMRADLAEARKTLKGANIKVKSATTKLDNARNQLEDAKTKLSELLQPES